MPPALEKLDRGPAPTVRQEPAYVPPTPLPRSAFNPGSSQLNVAYSLPATAAGDGSPLSLVDLVQKTSSRSRRTEAVQEYWKAAVALLDLRFAEEELSTLQSGPAPDSSLKRSAVAVARARVAEARMELRRQREELASRYGAPIGEPLPLPADRPFVGPYDTKILGIYSSRRPPRDAIELDQLIAETGEIAAARGEAAAHASDARNAAGGTIEQYLAAFDRCRDARIAYLAAVRDYNLAIANYALYVSDPSLPAASIAKMLVDMPAAPTDPVAARTATSPTPPKIVATLGETRPPLPPGAVLISSVPIDPSEMGKPIGPVAMATPPELPAVAANVQPASANVPAEEIAFGGRNDVAEANPSFDPPRELAPSEADEPMLQDAGEPAELSEFQPSPQDAEPKSGGLQPQSEALQPLAEALQPLAEALQPAEGGLVPTETLQEQKPLPPVTGLEFSGAATR
jgi:hypothetical protein